MTTQDMTLTLENFTERTGRRFRISQEQKRRIEAGEITREQAFQEFLSNGGLDRVQATPKPEVPAEVYLFPGITLQTFGDVSEQLTGQRRRFRVSATQAERIRAGEITREQAFAETVAQIREENS